MFRNHEESQRRMECGGCEVPQACAFIGDCAKAQGLTTPPEKEPVRQRLAERTAMIEELVWAMHLWGGYEDDSIHHDAYPAFRAAIELVGIPITEERLEYDTVNMRYRFDLAWAERQRAVWRRRNGEEIG